MGLVGAWIAIAMDEIFRAGIVFARWTNKKWQGKRVVCEEVTVG